jgi:hypothetical protein
VTEYSGNPCSDGRSHAMSGHAVNLILQDSSRVLGTIYLTDISYMPGIPEVVSHRFS